MEQQKDFADILGVREQFIVKFIREFQARECRGGEYVVWVEYFDPNRDALQLHYDGGTPVVRHARQLSADRRTLDPSEKFSEKL